MFKTRIYWCSFFLNEITVQKKIEQAAQTGDAERTDVTQQEADKSNKATTSAPKKLTDAEIVARLDEKQLKIVS